MTGSRLKLRSLAHTLVAAACLLAAPLALADNQAIAIDEMAGYLEFADYGAGVILAEQIPGDEWPRIHLIDARDAGQFAKEHIPGAVNIDWRQVLVRRREIPKDRTVLIYCNSGSLSAQAGFALRVAGWDNVRILQGGMQAWKAQGSPGALPLPRQLDGRLPAKRGQ